MQEINRAFEELRAAVPALPPECVPDKNGDSSKLTKITTLRLAVNYIAALSRMLREANESEENSSEVDSVQSIDSLGIESRLRRRPAVDEHRPRGHDPRVRWRESPAQRRPDAVNWPSKNVCPT
ncbi:hypothetical protein MTO96_041838 [Rhipicephalus appendiculatus]